MDLEAAVCVAEVGGARAQAHAGGATVGRVGQRGWLVEVERNFCWGGCCRRGVGVNLVVLGLRWLGSGVRAEESRL